MTNKEKYGDKLIELSVNRGSYVLKNGSPALCWNTECRECDFYDKSSRTCKKMYTLFKNGLIQSMPSHLLIGARLRSIRRF